MSRIDYFQMKPEMISKLREITAEQRSFRLDGKLRTLIELRVSQINGCVYCTELHSREVRHFGESLQRLDTLPVWRESPFFDVREKAALAWAEKLTLVATSHSDEAEYLALEEQFSDAEIVEIGIAVSLANFWNRMAGGFRRMPAVH